MHLRSTTVLEERCGAVLTVEHGQVRCINTYHEVNCHAAMANVIGINAHVVVIVCESVGGMSTSIEVNKATQHEFPTFVFVEGVGIEHGNLQTEDV